MLADRIANALKSRSPQTITGDGFKPAAVLIPLQEKDDGDYLVLTQRADHLNHHSGQIAFPGGRVDDSDADEIDAALRESHEEIGKTMSPAKAPRRQGSGRGPSSRANARDLRRISPFGRNDNARPLPLCVRNLPS